MSVLNYGTVFIWVKIKKGRLKNMLKDGVFKVEVVRLRIL